MVQSFDTLYLSEVGFCDEGHFDLYVAVEGQPAEDADRLLDRGPGDVIRLVGQHGGVHLPVARDAEHRLARVLQVGKVEETSEKDITNSSRIWATFKSLHSLTCPSRSCVSRREGPTRAGVSTGPATAMSQVL